MKEIWKFWKEYGVSRFYKKGSKLYVSNLGRVRVDDKIVERKPNKNGYIMLCRKELSMNCLSERYLKDMKLITLTLIVTTTN